MSPLEKMAERCVHNFSSGFLVVQTYFASINSFCTQYTYCFHSKYSFDARLCKIWYESYIAMTFNL